MSPSETSTFRLIPNTWWKIVLLHLPGYRRHHTAEDVAAERGVRCVRVHITPCGQLSPSSLLDPGTTMM
ncbi:hypothetical protein ACHWQZ_G011962 [Mnemiopsis leidyi]